MTNNLDKQSAKTRRSASLREVRDDVQSAFQPNEKLLIIMNKDSGLAPYSHEFCRSNLDPQVISGFISAMTSFMGFVTGEQQSNWKTVYGSESEILVETGEWTYGVLAVARVTNEARCNLSRVTSEFEDCFKVLKNSDDIEGSAFREFDQLVRKLFVDDRITNGTLVMKRLEWKSSGLSFDLPSTTFNVSKLFLGIEAAQSVQEIAEFHSLPIEEVVEHVSKAFWNNAVYLKLVPTANDVLTLSKDTSSIVFQKGNPLHLSDKSLKVISQFDGRTKLSSAMNGLNPLEMKILLEDLGELVNRGHIQRISEECRFVILNECILSTLSCRGSQIVGRKNMTALFDQIREKGNKQHPWINRVRLTDMMHTQCIFEVNSNPDVLNDICDALEFFIEELTQRLSGLCSKYVINRLLNSIIDNCRELCFPNRANVGMFSA